MIVHPHGVDIAPATKRALLDQEIASWRNTQYIASVRLRVHRKIGSGDETEAALIADMERCEIAIDALAEELAALAI